MGCDGDGDGSLRRRGGGASADCNEENVVVQHCDREGLRCAWEGGGACHSVILGREDGTSG